ncbi:hypothetical protein T484DRAFT_1760833 [Baffinella frigidus]|nr:hypothetical protein T484DRAFT_1760833 [Cryptophyta sp. CCMP2293]
MGGGARLSALLLAALPLLCAKSPPRAPCGDAGCWGGAPTPRRGAEPSACLGPCMRLRGGWKERGMGGRPMKYGRKEGLSEVHMAKEARKSTRQKKCKKIEPSWAKQFLRQKGGLIDPKDVKKAPRTGPGRLTESSRKRWLNQHLWGQRPPALDRLDEQRRIADEQQQAELREQEAQKEKDEKREKAAQKELDDDKPSPPDPKFVALAKAVGLDLKKGAPPEVRAVLEAAGAGREATEEEEEMKET